MPLKKAVKFTKDVDNIEEQYIRSGGKDPYVLTLLTRAYSDGKKAKDVFGKKNMVKNYETMKQQLIRQYNDVELENVKLQYELKAIQSQLKSQVPEKPTKSNQPPANASSNTAISPPKSIRSPIKNQSKEYHVPLVNTRANNFLPAIGNQSLFGFPGLGGLPTNMRFPFGNTYIVTGDEIYINGMDVSNSPRSPNSQSMLINKKLPPSSDNESAKRQLRRFSAPQGKKFFTGPEPNFGIDADWDSEIDEDVEYNGESFFEVNPSVPQGKYDYNIGIIVFFDFATKIPKEARYCRLSVALVSAGKMKPPISFPALTTEQYGPGDHPEFKHFTTTCRFAYNLAVSGGRPFGQSARSGISLIVELMISADKPVDEQAPVLGWIRHGWAPITATKASITNDSDLTTYAGRFRTMLRKNLPLQRGADGLLELSDDSKIVDQRTEIFYRIANANQSSLERLAPVDVKQMAYYDEF